MSIVHSFLHKICFTKISHAVIKSDSMTWGTASEARAFITSLLKDNNLLDY